VRYAVHVVCHAVCNPHFLSYGWAQVKIRCWSCGVKKQGKCGELFMNDAVDGGGNSPGTAVAALQPMPPAVPLLLPPPPPPAAPETPDATSMVGLLTAGDAACAAPSSAPATAMQSGSALSPSPAAAATFPATFSSGAAEAGTAPAAMPPLPRPASGVATAPAPAPDAAPGVVDVPTPPAPPMAAAALLGPPAAAAAVTVPEPGSAGGAPFAALQNVRAQSPTVVLPSVPSAPLPAPATGAAPPSSHDHGGGAGLSAAALAVAGSRSQLDVALGADEDIASAMLLAPSEDFLADEALDALMDEEDQPPHGGLPPLLFVFMIHCLQAQHQHTLC
jgi:hypothetical protein